MIITAERRGITDGPAHAMLSQVNSPIPIVLMSRTNRFKFNEELLNLDKYILVEFSEMGWDWDLDKSGSHIWGINTDKFPQFEDDDYKRFDDFVASKPPLLTFTRELLQRDVTSIHRPIDYPCWYQPKEIQDKATFNRRPISSFHFWGRSHEARLRLHANTWLAASQKGFSVCDNLNYFDEFVMKEDGEKWVSLWIPHYGRVDVREILGRQEFSKTSIALPGAGNKTFRHCEASLNSVMVKWKDNLACSFPWDETNCILTEEGKEIEDIEKALQDENLYEKYIAGVANCQKYSINNYVQYIEKQISKIL